MNHSSTHLDVEDVLSSIRRLVSDGPGDRDGEKSADLFVLTPAHRVDETAVPSDTPIEGPANEPLDLSQPPVELAVRETDESMLQPAEPVSTDATFEAHAETPTTRVENELVILTDRVTEEPEDAHIEADDAPAPQDSLAESAPEKTLLEQRIAELERAVGKVEDDFEPDGSEPQDIQQPKLHFLQRYRDRFEVIDGDGIDRDAPEPRADADATVEVPRAPEQEEYAPPPLNLGDVAMFTHTPRRFEPAPSDLPEDPAETAVQNASGRELVDGNDEFFVDEEVLRGLVSDIVKNELQGRLGERITRNVRRMVRHEIEKALSLKSLE